MKNFDSLWHKHVHWNVWQIYFYAQIKVLPRQPNGNFNHPSKGKCRWWRSVIERITPEGLKQVSIYDPRVKYDD